MSRELYWLTLTVGMTALFWIPYVLNRVAVRGVGGTLANPKPEDRPLAPWATRARAAHANAIENLALFAPAALVLHALGMGNHTTDVACALYFYSRLAHFVLYTAGIPGLRTFAFTGGWVGTAILLLRLLGAV